MQSNMVSHSHLITGGSEARLGIQTAPRLSSFEVTEVPLAVSFFETWFHDVAQAAP